MYVYLRAMYIGLKFPNSINRKIFAISSQFFSLMTSLSLRVCIHIYLMLLQDPVVKKLGLYKLTKSSEAIKRVEKKRTYCKQKQRNYKCTMEGWILLNILSIYLRYAGPSFRLVPRTTSRHFIPAESSESSFSSRTRKRKRKEVKKEENRKKTGRKHRERFIFHSYGLLYASRLYKCTIAIINRALYIHWRRTIFLVDARMRVVSVRDV